MQSAQPFHEKFELLILNQIYNTVYFNPDLLSKEYDSSSLLNIYLAFQKTENLDETSNNKPLINEILAITLFISEPKNFSCYDKIAQLTNILGDKIYFYSEKKTQNSYTFLDVIVFSSLHNCKLWSKLYRPQAKIPQVIKSTPLEKLFKWFQSFEETFTDLIKYRFNPSILSQKNQKKQEKQSKLKKRNPDFINAVGDSATDKVIELLKQGVDIQVVDANDGSSAAHIACLKGDLYLCKLLDSYGVNWEAEDLENVTPVFNAIESANIDLVSFLYNKKVNFEHLDFQNRTPFYHSCCFGNLEIISYLYTHCHCNPNTKSNKNRTALSKACFLAKPQVVEYLLSLPPKDFPLLDDIDDKGRTALHNASWGPAGGKEGKYLNGKLINDSPESAKMLIDKGATVDFADFDGNTPFIVAAASAAIETMRILYNYGANINYTNKKHETALNLACKFGHLSSIKVLIEEMNADLSINNSDGMSNLVCCLMNEQKEVFNYLKGSESKSKNDENYEKDFNFLLFNKNEKLYETMNIFIDFIYEKNINIKFQDDYIKLMSSFDNKEIFILIFNFFHSQITYINKQQLFYQIIEKNKLIFFVIFLEKDPLFFKDFIVDYHIIIPLIKNNAISSDFLEKLLYETNIDFLKDSDDLFLHFLVDCRKIALLISLRKLFSCEFSQYPKKISNKYLLELLNLPKEEKDFQIIEFLLKRDLKTEMNCFEYAKFKKSFDIEKILKDFSEIFLKSSEIKIENYHIPYKLIEDFHPKDQLIEDFHSKKAFLEEINQEIYEKQEFPKQYLNINSEETKFFEKILKNPDKFEKKHDFHYIKTDNELQIMTEELKKFSIFGVDLEYLSTGSSEMMILEGKDLTDISNIPANKYSGFVCTLQLSTIERDYIIDAIYLRDKISSSLKEFFEDFNKIKIFHGCDFDLQWLKVDFGIETMNIFDTARGYMILNNDKNAISLAKLTKSYLNIDLDKSFQKSFWAMRPLPKVMLDYARLDSGILLGLFPCVFQELKEKKGINQMAICCNRISFEKIEKIKMRKTNFLVLK